MGLLNLVILKVFITIIQITLVQSLDNGLALTPPMGWMSWERYRCNINCELYPDDCISENLYRRMADILVEEGYADLGYKYVIIDDCWLEKTRDSDGRLQPDRDRFPSGLKNLSDYIHSKGLFFGLYEDYGSKTCAGYPGIIDHMEEDAKQFIEWGVDYVKLDGCYSDTKTMDKGYPEFGEYLQKYSCKDRSIVYSCSWPVYQEEEGILPDFKLISENCNLWRNYNDIDDSFDSVKSIIQHFAKMQDYYAPHAGPGHWNDPDMLIIGNFGLSFEQSKLQMAMWAILAAPLIMSNDLGNIWPQFKEILQNKEVIAVNQDSLGIQGRRIYRSCQQKYLAKLGVAIFWNQMTSSGVMRCQNSNQVIEVWVRPIGPIVGGYNSYAIAFVSYRTDGTPYAFSATLKDLGLYYPGTYIIKDLFSDEPEFEAEGGDARLNVFVNPTGVVLLKATIKRSQNPNCLFDKRCSL